MPSFAGGTGNYIYAWSNGSNDQNPTDLFAGMYSVTVTDDGGCSQVFTDIEEVTEPDALSLTENITHVDCNGEATGAISINVSGGTPNYSYNWTGGSSGSSISNVAAGNYLCNGYR